MALLISALFLILICLWKKSHIDELDSVLKVPLYLTESALSAAE